MTSSALSAHASPAMRTATKIESEENVKPENLKQVSGDYSSVFVIDVGTHSPFCQCTNNRATNIRT